MPEMNQELSIPPADPIQNKPKFSAFTKGIAKLISILFHPLFISSYVFAFLIFIHPASYSGVEERLKVFRFLTIFLFNAFFPGFAVFLAWRLGFVNSITLQTVRERIIPYILAMFFYWWTWNVFHNLPDSPPEAMRFTLGAFLAICGGWLWNIYFKISMHAIAVGGLLMFMILFSAQDPFASGVYLSVTVFVTGLVMTARFIVSDHSQAEIYSGLITGMLAQWVASWIY